MTTQECLLRTAKFTLVALVALVLLANILFVSTDEMHCEGDWIKLQELAQKFKENHMPPDTDLSTTSTKPVKTGQGFCEWIYGVQIRFVNQTLFRWRTRYDGEWKDNAKDGYGVFDFMTGNRFTGNWKKGKREGRGTLQLFEGPTLIGDWHEDLPLSNHVFEINYPLTEATTKRDGKDIMGLTKITVNGALLDGHLDGLSHIDFFSKGEKMGVLNVRFLGGKLIGGSEAKIELPSRRRYEILLLTSEEAKIRSVDNLTTCSVAINQLNCNGSVKDSLIVEDHPNLVRILEGARWLEKRMMFFRMAILQAPLNFEESWENPEKAEKPPIPQVSRPRHQYPKEEL
eukprot:TRINITY_DN12934_c0_g1_i1.p1 TRINITY_DN12934_c0_g1~~TRINITY_DN12934_c0_g1_i1.p1  ORF type:complete len:343 (+),score=66.13 TRINITY_DN12934_c0_g1_i1:3-1031(+)